MVDAGTGREIAEKTNPKSGSPGAQESSLPVERQWARPETTLPSHYSIARSVEGIPGVCRLIHALVDVPFLCPRRINRVTVPLCQGRARAERGCVRGGASSLVRCLAQPPRLSRSPALSVSLSLDPLIIVL